MSAMNITKTSTRSVSVVDYGQVADPTAALSLTVPGKGAVDTISVPAQASRVAADLKIAADAVLAPMLSIGTVSIYVGDQVAITDSAYQKTVDTSNDVTVSYSDNKPAFITGLAGALLAKFM